MVLPLDVSGYQHNAVQDIVKMQDIRGVNNIGDIPIPEFRFRGLDSPSRKTRVGIRKK